MATIEQTPSNPGPELEGADIRVNIDNLNDGFEYSPLFDDESITDDALQGNDTANDTADAEPIVEGAQGKEPEKDQEAKEPEKEPEKKEPEKEPEKEEPKEAEKPRAGYVPLPALQQERQASKALKAEVARLSAELAKATSAPVEETDEYKDFKVLNDAEFEALLGEDPDEATRYQYKFTKFQDHQRKVQDRQLVEQRAVRAREAMVNESMAMINELLPGLYNGGNEMAPKLVEFAEKNGVHPEWVNVLTDPRTEIKTPDGKQLLMSHGAVQLVHLLKASHEALSKIPSEAALRSQIEAELRPKIEAEIQSTLTRKLQHDPEAFRSIDQITGAAKREAQPRSGVLSEAEFSRLTPAQQAQLLGG